MPDLPRVEATVEETVDRATRDLTTLYARLQREQRELQDKWGSLTRTARQRNLGGLLTATIDAERQARRLIAGQVPPAFADAYAAALAEGVKDGLAELGVSRALLAEFTRDTMSSLLAATGNVTDTTKGWVRTAARGVTLDQLFGGATPEVAARRLRAELAQRGIHAVRYRDGSRHQMGEYARMVTRTKSAELYQAAAFAQAEESGIRFCELLDNPSCGLTEHDDDVKANGLILPLDEARRWPLSHPNCVRAIQPRADVTSADRLPRQTTRPEQDRDQEVVERFRARDPITPDAYARFEERVRRDRAGRLAVDSDQPTARQRYEARVAAARARAAGGE